MTTEHFTREDVIAAGGIVHRDGNVFFTNLDKMNAMFAAKLKEWEAQGAVAWMKNTGDDASWAVVGTIAPEPGMEPLFTHALPAQPAEQHDYLQDIAAAITAALAHHTPSTTVEPEKSLYELLGMASEENKQLQAQLDGMKVLLRFKDAIDATPPQVEPAPKPPEFDSKPLEQNTGATAPSTAVDRQTPFANCRFQICDLPGQCKGEGKCHHPAVQAATPAALPVGERKPLKVEFTKEWCMAAAEREAGHDVTAGVPVGELTLPEKRDIGEFDPKKSSSTFFRGLGWNEAIDEVAGLLAAARSQPVREPLSKEDLFALVQATREKVMLLSGEWAENHIHAYQFASSIERALGNLVREIEAAHGITKKGAPGAAKEQTP